MGLFVLNKVYIILLNGPYLVSGFRVDGLGWGQAEISYQL